MERYPDTLDSVFIVFAEEGGWNGSTNEWIVRVCSSRKRAQQVVKYNTRKPTHIKYSIKEWHVSY